MPSGATRGGHPEPLRRDPEDDRDTVANCPSLADAALDPLFCQLALQAGVTPSLVQASSSQTPRAVLLGEDLQHLIAGLARRVAWGGDRRRGSARIELSEGLLAGATLTVHTEQRSVSVELELPSGTALAGDWQQRILERLEGRGFSAHVRVD